MMKISPSGISFIRSVEGCILHPYHGDKDPAGVMTIYVGHVIRPGETFKNTIEDAERVLRSDLGWVHQYLYRHVHFSTIESPGRQHNFDALCSLVFNAGHVFDDVLAIVNGSNDSDELRSTWMKHTRAGNDAKALTYRRAKEVALYLTPDPPTFTPEEVQNALTSVWETARGIIADDGFAAV